MILKVFYADSDMLAIRVSEVSFGTGAIRAETTKGDVLNIPQREIDEVLVLDATGDKTIMSRKYNSRRSYE